MTSKAVVPNLEDEAKVLSRSTGESTEFEGFPLHVNVRSGIILTKRSELIPVFVENDFGQFVRRRTAEADKRPI